MRSGTVMVGFSYVRYCDVAAQQGTATWCGGFGNVRFRRVRCRVVMVRSGVAQSGIVR